MRAGDVEFVGVATVQVGHERTIEFVAIFRTAVDRVAAYEPTDEIDQLAEWDLVSDLPRLSAIDAHLAQIAVDRLPDRA
jgi:hypothetical protein